MARTVLSDVDFNSEVFRDAVQGYFTERLELLNSLAVEAPDEIVSPDSTGYTTSIPEFQTLSGDSDQITTSLSTTINSLPTYKDTLAWMEREKAWGADQIIKTIAGLDVPDEIARQLGQYWAGEVHKSLISLLTGIFATALASSHVKNDDGNTINIAGLSAAKLLLGDNADLLSAIVMNSKVETDALVSKILTYDKAQVDSFASGKVGSILGLVPFVTDKLTAVANLYSSYIGARGSAIYKFRKRKQNRLTDAEVFDLGMIEVEKYRIATAAGGQDALISRASYTVHVPGVQFDGTVASNPTNAQLATGTTWTKVADDDKKILLVQYKCN